MTETDRTLQIGGRIRRLRRQMGLSQAGLAEAVEISPSYLNLIEHNRRRVTVALLFKFAAFFETSPGELNDGDEGQLQSDLQEIFADPVFGEIDMTNQDVREIALSSPNMGRAVLRLFDSYVKLARSQHSGPDDAEVRQLRHHPATEEISDFLQINANHFPELEETAGAIRSRIDAYPGTFESRLAAYMSAEHRLEWRSAPLPPPLARRLDAGGRVLSVADTLPRPTAVFQAVHHLSHLAAEDAIDAVIGRSEISEEAMSLARNVLVSYTAGAMILPYAPFRQACLDLRYDIERIMHLFSASFEQVTHRMTTLQRPGAAGIPMHLIRTDVAGNISKRFSLSGIHIPRHAGACPRWNVHSAFLQPGRFNVQLSEMPDGRRFFCVARSEEKGNYGHHAPSRHVSVGLGCDIVHARKIVYSDGIDLTDERLMTPIGVSCGVCPRGDCSHRAHPPVDHRFDLSPGERADSLYGAIR